MQTSDRRGSDNVRSRGKQMNAKEKNKRNTFPEKQFPSSIVSVDSLMRCNCFRCFKFVLGVNV